nr:MAG TPA: hypothetical protein [Bacteriophage sp.]
MHYCLEYIFIINDNVLCFNFLYSLQIFTIHGIINKRLLRIHTFTLTITS